MTRSVNRRIIQGISAGVLASALTAGAALQLDINAGMVAGVNDSNYTPPRTDPATSISGNIHGSFALAKPLFLILEDNPDFLFVLPSSITDSVNGTGYLEDGKHTIAERARKYHGSNNAYLGLKLDQAGLWEVGFRSIAFYSAQHYGFSKNPNFFADYFSKDINGFYYYLPLTRNTLSGSYLFENDKFIAHLSTNLFLNQGSIDSILSDANGADSIGVSQKYLDRVLRTNAVTGVRLPLTGTLVSVGALIQNHIDRAKSLNISMYHAGLSGDANLANNRLAYQIRSNIYSQDYLTDTNAFPEKFSTGFFQSVYLRDSYTLDAGLMVKGLAVMTIGKEVLKQRYELAVRKSWQNESWCDLGYFTLMGVYFPEQGTYLRTMYRPIEKIGIGISGKGVWQWPIDSVAPDNKIKYIRTVLDAELSYRISSGIELYAGGDYFYYNRLAVYGFPNRYSLAIGTRAFLP